MTTLTRAQAELLEARRVRRYIQAKLKSTEDDPYWRRRLSAQEARISALTDEQIRQEVRLAHE